MHRSSYPSPLRKQIIKPTQSTCIDGNGFKASLRKPCIGSLVKKRKQHRCVLHQSITSQPDPFDPHKRTQKENRNLYIQYLPTSNRGRGPPTPNVVAVQKQKSPAPPPCVPQRKVSCPGISLKTRIQKSRLGLPARCINFVETTINLYRSVPLYQHMITFSRHLIRLRITVVTIFSRHLHGPGLLRPKSLGDWNMQTSTQLLGSSRHKKKEMNIFKVACCLQG